MTKKESIVLVVLCAVLVGGVVAYALFGAHQPAAQSTENSDSSEQSNRVDIPLGQVVTLNSRAEEENASSSGIVRFTWDGTMELSVLDATLYDGSSMESLPSEVRDEMTTEPPEDCDILLVHIHLKNVDAEPTAVTLSGSRAFNASDFGLASVSNSGFAGELVYFSGTPQENRNGKDNLCFLLPEGEEATYALAYVVCLDESSRLYSGMPTHLEPGTPSQGKYQLSLGDVAWAQDTGGSS